MRFTLLVLFLSTVSCSSDPVPQMDSDGLTDDALLQDDDGGAGPDDPSSPPTTAVRADPFASAPPWASTPAVLRAATRHADGKVAVVPSKETKCLTCHAAGVSGAAPKFLLGGTVYEDTAGAKPAKDVELGIVDSAGTSLFVHSDDDGNFWLPAAQAATLVFPAYVGARTSAMTKPMKRKIGAAADLECNSCHNAGNPIAKP